MINNGEKLNEAFRKLQISYDCWKPIWSDKVSEYLLFDIKKALELVGYTHDQPDILEGDQE